MKSFIAVPPRGWKCNCCFTGTFEEAWAYGDRVPVQITVGNLPEATRTALGATPGPLALTLNGSRLKVASSAWRHEAGRYRLTQTLNRRGGQYQIGQLTNLTTGEHRTVSAAILGLDLGQSLFITAAASGGVFSMPTPPGAVDFDWFDNRFIVLTSVGASAVIGADHSTVRFRNPDGPWPEASFANYPLGLTVGAGGIAMIGFLSVDS